MSEDYGKRNVNDSKIWGRRPDLIIKGVFPGLSEHTYEANLISIKVNQFELLTIW